MSECELNVFSQVSLVSGVNGAGASFELDDALEMMSGDVAVTRQHDNAGRFENLFLSQASGMQAFFDLRTLNNDKMGGLEIIAARRPMGRIDNAFQKSARYRIRAKRSRGTAGLNQLLKIFKIHDNRL